MEREFKDETAIQYLLGQLSEQEREQFEERYFTDESFFENFLAVKEELIDLYARDELPSHQLEQFEKHVLASPTLRQRIDDTKRIIATVSKPSAESKLESLSMIKQEPSGWWRSLVGPLIPDSRILQFSLGALVLIALVLGGLLWQARSRRARIEAERRQQIKSSPHLGPAQNGSEGHEKNAPSTGPSVDEATKVPVLPESATPSKSRVPAANIATITLTPVVLRSSDNSPRLYIEPNTRVARLILVIKSVDYKSYVAVVRTIEGAEVRSMRGLEARKTKSGAHVTIDLPAELLTRQAYLVTLSGTIKSGSVEEIGNYYLVLERTTP